MARAGMYVCACARTRERALGRRQHRAFLRSVLAPAPVLAHVRLQKDVRKRKQSPEQGRRPAFSGALRGEAPAVCAGGVRGNAAGPPPPRAPLSRARGQGACRLACDPQRVGGLGGSGSRPAASRSAHPSPPGSAVACGQGSRLWPSPSCPRHSLRRCLNGEARGVRTGVEASRRPAGRVVRVRVSPARAQRSPPRSRVAAVTHSM